MDSDRLGYAARQTGRRFSIEQFLTLDEEEQYWEVVFSESGKPDQFLQVDCFAEVLAALNQWQETETLVK